MRTSQLLILVPMLMQVALTLTVLVMLGIARDRDLKQRGLRPDDIALAAPEAWGEDARKLAASYKNQFELPLLFFAACLFAHTARLVDFWLLLLAMIFAVSRMAHAAIHVGPNRVMPRFYAFLVGLVAVALMWALLAARVAGSGF
ncbi:MAG: MAPEG family protein [Hyphomicrobiaceae bacterium]|nr:MAPEG family protein [Hyphomicrobiaceae bacterium]